jgi:hypothetical protein
MLRFYISGDSPSLAQYPDRFDPQPQTLCTADIEDRAISRGLSFGRRSRHSCDLRSLTVMSAITGQSSSLLGCVPQKRVRLQPLPDTAHHGGARAGALRRRQVSEDFLDDVRLLCASSAWQKPVN